MKAPAPIAGQGVIHGLWIGTQLSRLELLTLHSFVRFGHPFQLWLYDELETPLPDGVTVRDASEILPRSRIFKTRQLDPETGVGKDAYPPFSDLFRYKLLYEQGGTWVDMDVTCLQPFDFAGDYLFRSHRVGVIGNILKCPKGSELMRATFEEVDAIAGEQLAWLTPTRILNKHIERLELGGYTRRQIWNEDDWLGAIRPFYEESRPIPPRWVAIHWVNEFLRTLRASGGNYRGRRVVEEIPDKDAPRPGSTLHELYRYYGLIDPWASPALASRSGALPESPPAPVSRNLPRTDGPRPLGLNIYAPSLVRGGAERIITETADGLRLRKEVDVLVAVDKRSLQQYVPKIGAQQRLIYLGDEKGGDALRRLALEVLGSRNSVLYTHLIGAQTLTRLWRLGVRTIPVVHNSVPGWLDPPSAYDNKAVPFVVACSDSVAEQLRASGCQRPVVTLRHELQRWFSAEELARGREQVRDQYGIDDATVLVGMVGQFKAQKAYTRAIRVLARLREVCRAKLVILGGWDHSYGTGRAAHEAACRLALELGVINDVVMPGNIEAVGPQYGAFDVFLNTSVYEGLSISLLEAINAGCPVVSADVGGNREVLPESAVLVTDPADADEYVAGILAQLAGAQRSQRLLPAAPADRDFVPRLWALLARYGVGSSAPPAGEPRGTLFITANLHIGGPAKSIVTLLSALASDSPSHLCVLGGISVQAFVRELAAAQVPILPLADTADLLDRVTRVLHWIDHLNVRHVCFWNVPPEFKLALAKILHTRTISIIDVSPGPMLFDELAAAAAFQRRVCLSARQYLERLDCFVALYREGTPETSIIGARSRTTRIIPRSVAAAPRFVPLPPPQAMLPRHFDPAYAVGTCCRLVPDKRVEFLLEMIEILRRSEPRSTLTIVGGPDIASMEYAEGLHRQVREQALEHVRLVGRAEDVNPFLARFKVFVMVSDRQGCPNASLEAMAMRLPVIANPSGGTAEQIVDGVTGFLVDTPAQMAARVAELLGSPERRRAMGEAALARVRAHFGVEQMASAFRQILE